MDKLIIQSGSNLKDKNRTIKVSTLVLILYASLVFIRVVLFSSFSSIYSSIGHILHYFTYVPLLLILLLYVFCFKKSKRQLIIAGVFTFIIFLGGLRGDLFSDFNIMLFLSLALLGSGLVLQQIALAQSISMLLALGGISVLSLLGFLPKSGASSKLYSFQTAYNEILYFFGFNHPNVYGNILTMAIIALFFGLGCRYHKEFTILMFLVFLTDLKIGSNTAGVGAFIFFVGLALSSSTHYFSQIIDFSTKVLIITLPIFAFWIGYHSYNNLSQWLNNRIASRPSIWSYYLNSFGIHLFAKPPVFDLSVGASGVTGNGALDGLYVYSVIYWGLVPLIIICLSFWVLATLNIDKGRLKWFTTFLALSITVMAFPESHMGFFFENIFILSIGLLQFSPINRVQAFMHEEKGLM